MPGKAGGATVPGDAVAPLFFTALHTAIGLYADNGNLNGNDGPIVPFWPLASLIGDRPSRFQSPFAK